MKLFLIAFALITSVTCFSSHASGGYISYEPTGLPNEYEVTLTVYRDCGGSNFGINQYLNVINTCNPSDSSNVHLTFESVTDVTQFCPQSINPNSCVGTERRIYKGIITLNGTCNEWSLNYTAGYRNPNVNTISTNPLFWQVNNLHIETKLNNSDFPLNSSPVRNTNYPIPYTFINQSTDLAIFFNDPDHDSLVFSLENAYEYRNALLSYVSPYTYQQPIPGITIDSTTGHLNFSHSMTGNFLISIDIKEYSENGTLKGTTRFDFTVVIEFLSDLIPVMGSTQNFNSFNTNSSIANHVINAGPGDQFCFEVMINDPDLSDSIFLSSDIEQLYPGATFTQTGFNPATATVCWNHQPGDQRSIFSIVAQDDSPCPALRISSLAYLLNLSKKIEFAQSPLYLCDTSLVYDLITSDSADYYWYDLNGSLLDVGVDISCNPCMSAKLYFDNDTSIIVRHDNQNICTDTLDIKANFFSTSSLQDTVFYCLGDSITLTTISTELTSIWNNELIQDSIVINFTADSIVYLETSYNWHCPIFDSIITIPVSHSDALVDTLIQCQANPNITIASTNASWYDINGQLLDIGSDISCNPCGNPQFFFTNDTIVYKPINEYCSTLDTIHIRQDQLNEHFEDTIFFCDEEIVELTNPFTFYNPIWHTNETTDTISFQTNNSIVGSLSIYIDTMLCDSTSFLLFSQQTDATITLVADTLTTEPFTSYQWYFNNGPILGETNQYLKLSGNGDYFVSVVDSIGCTDSSDTFIFNSASFNDLKDAIDILIINNQIVINNAPINAIFELYDISGKLIESRLLNSESAIIELPKVNQVYIVKLMNQHQEVITVRKLKH